MYQGWSRRNNPQAKVLTTVPRTAWHQGVVSYTVSLGTRLPPRVLRPNPVCAALQGWTEYFLS